MYSIMDEKIEFRLVLIPQYREFCEKHKDEILGIFADCCKRRSAEIIECVHWGEYVDLRLSVPIGEHIVELVRDMKSDSRRIMANALISELNVKRRESELWIASYYIGTALRGDAPIHEFLKEQELDI